MEVTDKQPTLKLILLGPSNSGKSSLLLRFSSVYPPQKLYTSCLCSREISLKSLEIIYGTQEAKRAMELSAASIIDTQIVLYWSMTSLPKAVSPL